MSTPRWSRIRSRFQRRESAEARSPICGAPCHGADPTPPDHAIQPLLPVGGHGIGGSRTLEQTTAFHSIRAALAHVDGLAENFLGVRRARLARNVFPLGALACQSDRSSDQFYFLRRPAGSLPGRLFGSPYFQ